MMNQFLQTLVDGIAVGSLYALIALGYTMVYGVLQFINFAHGDVFMLGAWFSWSAAQAATRPREFQAPLTSEARRFAVIAAVVAAVAFALRFGLDRLRRGLPYRVFDWIDAVAAALLYAGGGIAMTVGVLYLGSYVGFQVAFDPGNPDASRITAAVTVLLTAMVCCGALGFAIERVAYRPLRSAPRLNVLITAIGVSLLLQNTAQLQPVFGTTPRPMPALVSDYALFEVAGVGIRSVDVTIVAVALVLMALLQALVYGTKAGLAMRAASYDAKTAALLGVPVDRTISLTFVVGSALAAAAGFLYVAKYHTLQQPASSTWVLLGLKAFVAAVVGGIGSIRGAMIGGLLIGLVEKFGTVYPPMWTGGFLSGDLREVYVFLILIAVLLVRPAGLLGNVTREKV